VKLLSGDGTVGDLLKDQYMRIAADGTSKAGTLNTETIASRLAWRSGMLVFEGQGLEQVLAEFSRYTSARFVITDPRLRELRIGGYFAAGDTAALREALKSNFGIGSRSGTDGVILIGPEPGSASLQ
jgi:ferric-dicitrate binding protein FerR (iron transport regulator)